MNETPTKKKANDTLKFVQRNLCVNRNCRVYSPNKNQEKMLFFLNKNHLVIANNKNH